MARWRLYPTKVQPVPVISGNQTALGTDRTVNLVFEKRLQYQAKTEPVFVPPVTFIGSFFAAAMIVAAPLLYQASTEPVFVPTDVTVDSWHRPLSEPIRQAQTTARQQVLAWGGSPAADIGWQTTWPDPRRGEPQTYQQALAWGNFTPTAVDIGWLAPWPEPVRRGGLQANQQQTLSWGAFTPAVTVDIGWFAPFSEPAKAKPLKQYQVWAGDTDPIVSFGWADKLSEPTRLKRITTHQALAWGAFTPQAAAPDYGWYQSWTLLHKETLEVAFASAGFGVSEDITEDRWHQPWSEPARVKPGLRVNQQQTLAWGDFTPTAEVITDIRWYQPWPDPTRRSGIQASQQQTLAWSGFTPAAEEITDIRWYAALSEPVRVKAGLRAQHQQVFVLDPYPLPSTAEIAVAPLFWTITQTVLVQYQALAEPVFTPTAETPTDMRWWGPWSEPIRRGGLQTHQQQAFAWDVFTPATPAFTDIRWFAPFSDPMRARWIAERQASAWSTFTPAPTTDIKWFAQLSEPIRVRPQAQWRQALAWGAFTPTVVTVEYGWFQSWTLPYRDILEVSLADVGFGVPAEDIRGWFWPLSEPIRTRPIVHKIALTWGAFTPTAEVVTEDKWHQPWSDPTRRKGLRENLQQVIAGPVFFTPEVVTLDKWYRAFSDPVRIKISLRVDLQRELFFDAFPRPNPDINSIDKWLSQWSIPVKLSKSGLMTAAQQPATIDPVTPPTPPPPAGGDFTVSGRTVQDIFPTYGVTYTYAPITRRTN